MFIWYPESSNRITDAPFTVYYSGGAMSQTTRVNQQLNGGVWLSLGQYFFAGGNAQERVVLTNATNDAVSTHYVIADAAGVATVMLTPVRMSRFDIE